MRIRQLVCMVGDRIAYEVGHERDCGEAEAIRLIDSGYAEPVGSEAIAAYKARSMGPPKVKPDDKPKRGRPPKVKPDDKPEPTLPNLADNDDEGDDLKDS